MENPIVKRSLSNIQDILMREPIRLSRDSELVVLEAISFLALLALFLHNIPPVK